MSKIARVFHLNKEIQKIYKNGVLQKLFFDWKHYIGEELNIEYAKGYCSHRININGKVYQNLVSNSDKLIGNVYTLKNNVKVISNLLRVSTTYTFIVSISEANYSDTNFGAIIVVNYPTLSPSYISISRKNGIFKIKCTIKEEIPKGISISPHANNDSTSSFKLKNLILLEGDLSSENITEDDIKYLEEGAFKPENNVIEGKTYQNLVDINSYQNVTGINLVDNKVEYQNTETQSVGVINPINIKANTKYTLVTDVLDINDYEKSYIIRVTDENNKWSLNLGSINANTIGKKFLVFTTPSDLTYFKILLYNSSSYAGIKFTFPILLEGDYTNIDLPNSINEIESVGEGEFIKSKNLISPNNLEYGNIDEDTGENLDATNTMKRTIDYIKVNSKTPYVINSSCRVFEYDNMKKFLSSNVTAGKFTTTENTEYIKVHGNTTNEFVEGKNLQLELGDTPTEYEPFYEYYPVTIRNYNYKCGTDNIILPNGVKNSIDTIDGKKVHTRRVGAVLLNGTQDMTISNVNQTLTTRVRIRMNNAKVSKNNLLCNWFIRTEAHGDYEYIIIQDSSEGICLFISVLNTKLSAPTADGVKQYFSENPLWVFYELATPIYTYLESGLYDDITIPTPSNIKNEIYLENGKWYHKRNIGKVVFDGSDDEQWKKDINNRFKCVLSIKAKLYNGRFPAYAEGYHFKQEQVHEDKLLFLFNYLKSIELYVYNYAYKSANAFKAYLAENPLEVYYELAEPVITELHYNDITYKLN